MRKYAGICEVSTENKNTPPIFIWTGFSDILKNIKR